MDEKNNKPIKIYLCESDPFEIKIGRAWVQKHDPKALTEGRVVDKVKLPKLIPSYVLIPIVRPEGCSPSLETLRDPFGKRTQVKEVPLEKLIGEIEPRKEIPVIAHWVRGSGGSDMDIFNSSFSGDVDVGSLFDALALVCQPCSPRIDVGDPEIMRLRRI